MTDPMRISVRTSTEGLELVEILARCGLPAALVSLPLGWQIEIAAQPELDGLPLHEPAVALESSAHLLRRRGSTVLAGPRRYDLRPQLDVVAPPPRAA